MAYLSARLRGRPSLEKHLESWKVLETQKFEILELSGLLG